MQALLSLGFIVIWYTPVTGSQPSIVQALLSLELIEIWYTPVNGSQPSVVQALLSFVFTGVWVITPVVETHASMVHVLLSSGLGGFTSVVLHV